MSGKQRKIAAGTIGLVGLAFFLSWATHEDCKWYRLVGESSSRWHCVWEPTPIGFFVLGVVLLGLAWFVWAGELRE